MFFPESVKKLRCQKTSSRRHVWSHKTPHVNLASRNMRWDSENRPRSSQSRIGTERTDHRVPLLPTVTPMAGNKWLRLPTPRLRHRYNSSTSTKLNIISHQANQQPQLPLAPTLTCHVACSTDTVTTSKNSVVPVRLFTMWVKSQQTDRLLHFKCISPHSPSHHAFSLFLFFISTNTSQFCSRPP